VNKADRRFQERSQRNALADREASRQKMLQKVGLVPEPDPEVDVFKALQEMTTVITEAYTTFGKALAQFGESLVEYARKARMMDLLYTEEYEDEYDELFSEVEDVSDEEREAECTLAP